MIEKYVGNEIRKYRKELGITQEQLALKAELDRTYIASVEAGRRNISINSLDKIVKALEIDMKTFFEGY